MPKSNLETSISQAATSFALHIVNAVKGATLQELIAMHGEAQPKRLGRKPGPKARKKPGPKPGPKAKATATKAVKKSRVVKNYPKCAYPTCKKNRFVRGKGFCGAHWKAFQAGKIKSAAEYKKK